MKKLFTLMMFVLLIGTACSSPEPVAPVENNTADDHSTPDIMVYRSPT